MSDDYDFGDLDEVRRVVDRCRGNHMVEIFAVCGRAVYLVATPEATISVPEAVDQTAAELGVTLTDDERQKLIEATRDAAGPEIFRRGLGLP